MPIFKKKSFIAEAGVSADVLMGCANQVSLDELVDAEGGFIKGDRNVVSNSEIETGPVQKPFNDTTDYEKGISTTTDRASRYKQDIPWFANMSSTTAGRRISETITKKAVEEKIEDLVKKSKYDGEISQKDYNPKVARIVDTIESSNLTDEQMDAIIKAIENKKNNPTKKI